MYIVRYKVRIKEGATIPYWKFLYLAEQPVADFIGDGEEAERKRESLGETGEYSERRQYDSLKRARSFMWFLGNIKTNSPKHWMASDGVTIEGVKLLKEVEV